MRFYKKRWLTILLVFIFSVLLSCTILAAEGGHIRIYLRAQGGSNGTSEISVIQGSALPDIIPPVRRGYRFTGYFAETGSMGEQYYESNGCPLKHCDFTDTAALYAGWEVETYSVFYENMDGAEFGSAHPSTHTYGMNTSVSDPTKEGYTFFGWQIGDSLVAEKGLTLGYASYVSDIVLTAVWNRAALVAAVDNATETVTMSSEDLRQVFQTQVSNPLHGVTADDLNSEIIKLTMTANDADQLAEGAADIIQLSQGEVLKFYDFSVFKSVTKQTNQPPVENNLNELPNTVAVQIELSNALKGRTSYRVYRYHDGTAQAIPHGPISDVTKEKEYFEVSTDGTSLTIHTRRLSTYAVVGGERSLGGTGVIEQGDAGVDVQAQVVISNVGPVYKLDIEWGPMRFQYATGREWDPDEHRYINVKINDWISGVSYIGGNNQILVRNHSNADVEVSFMVLPHLMEGVDMVISQENRKDAPPAGKLLLPKVPKVRIAFDELPTVKGYLRLYGTPTDPEFYEKLESTTDPEGYVQVGNVAVTILYKGGALTPSE